MRSKSEPSSFGVYLAIIDEATGGLGVSG